MRITIPAMLVAIMGLGSVGAAEPIMVGEGDWQFEILRHGISLPAPHGERVQDYHGVSLDQAGRVYVAYFTPEGTADESTRTLARFDYKPEEAVPFPFDRFLGDRSWVAGRVHGLNTITTPDGDERLLLVYNKKRVTLCDVDGRVDQKNSWLASHGVFGKASDGHFSPQSSHLGIYDGYASNILHELHLHDGTLVGHSHGGKGKAPGKTSTAHGVGVDHKGRYVIADRGNQRLLWLDPEFKPIAPKGEPAGQLELKLPGLEVCNVSFSKEGIAVVPCLNAKLAILKASAREECGYELAAVLTMPKVLIAKGYDGIHDANFTHDQRYLVVAVWQRERKTPPRLFALKRVMK